MRHVKALLIFVLLVASKRYRQRWNQTIERIDTDLDAVGASQRRIQTMEHGGRPRMRLL